MKLIDGDRLLKLMAGGGDPDYAHHLETNLFPKCTLDPADLDKMNLAALGVLKQAKDRFEVWKSNGVESMDAVLREIAHFESALGAAQLIQAKADDALEPASPEPKPRVGQEEPDYKAMYFEGDATIKKVYVTIKEHIERRFVKIEDTSRKSRTDVREKPEVKDGKQDELRSQRKPPTDCPPEKEKR